MNLIHDNTIPDSLTPAQRELLGYFNSMGSEARSDVLGMIASIAAGEAERAARVKRPRLCLVVGGAK